MTLKEHAEELKELTSQKGRPFPYVDCRKIQEMSGNRDEDFIPDLSTYFYDVWSPCHGIKRLLCKPLEEIEATRQYFTVPLEERYARYKPILALVSQDSTPDLFQQLEEVATMRQKLLDILALRLQN